MQDFTTKPFAATVLKEGITLSAGITKLAAREYEVYLSIEEAIAKNKAKLKEIRAKAKEEGLREGREAAHAQLLENVAQMTSNMDAWVKDTDQKLVQLVGTCVQEVVHKVDCATLIAQSVEAGLEQLPSAQSVQVRVHPDYTEEARSYLATHAPTLEYKIIADHHLAAGDCMMESAVGNVDLRLDTRISVLKESLGL